MPSRYTRDELIMSGLEMAQASNLMKHDAPEGVLLESAFSVRWFQDILDFYYHKAPFGSTVKREHPLNISANDKTVTAPEDFILDVRDGYIVQETENPNSKGRLLRVPLQKWLNRDLMFQTHNSPVPFFYMVNGRTISITPPPTKNVLAFLWYYQLPAKLESGEIPDVPSDFFLVEYIRIRALEWIGFYDIGTSVKYTDKLVGGMKAQGLLNEPEDDEIPMDVYVYRRNPRLFNSYKWMGPQ